MLPLHTRVFGRLGRHRDSIRCSTRFIGLCELLIGHSVTEDFSGMESSNGKTALRAQKLDPLRRIASADGGAVTQYQWLQHGFLDAVGPLKL